MKVTEALVLFASTVTLCSSLYLPVDTPDVTASPKVSAHSGMQALKSSRIFFIDIY